MGYDLPKTRTPQDVFIDPRLLSSSSESNTATPLQIPRRTQRRTRPIVIRDHTVLRPLEPRPKRGPHSGTTTGAAGLQEHRISKKQRKPRAKSTKTTKKSTARNAPDASNKLDPDGDSGSVVASDDDIRCGLFQDTLSSDTEVPSIARDPPRFKVDFNFTVNSSDTSFHHLFKHVLNPPATASPLPVATLPAPAPTPPPPGVLHPNEILPNRYEQANSEQPRQHSPYAFHGPNRKQHPRRASSIRMPLASSKSHPDY